MQYIFDNGVHKVARITGPEHNFLGIRVNDEEQAIEVVPLPVKNGELQRLNKNDVLNQVIEGLKEINNELGKNYSISQLYFVPSDSLSSSVYKYLTVELIRRIDSGGEFLAV